MELVALSRLVLQVAGWGVFGMGQSAEIVANEDAYS
jgi:hypothetical protein